MWQLICGNGIAKILGRNLIVILAMKLPKMRGGGEFLLHLSLKKRRFRLKIGGKKKRIVAIDLWQWNCRNRRKKKMWQLIYDNVVAEMGKKKKLWQ